MIDLWNPHTIMIESIITRLNQQPTCVRLNHDNPTAWPVHQNSLEDRLQVPSHLVVGSPFAEAERSRESRCSVKSDSVQTATRCGWNFLGKKEWIYVYTFREREREIYSFIVILQRYMKWIHSISQFWWFSLKFQGSKKRAIRIHQKIRYPVICFPWKKGSSFTHKFLAALLLVPAESDDAARLVLHHRRERGPPHRKWLVHGLPKKLLVLRVAVSWIFRFCKNCVYIYIYL